MRALIFLLDSSGSMDEPLNGRRKIETALDAVVSLFSSADLLADEDLASIMLFHATKSGDVPKVDTMLPLRSLADIKKNLDHVRKKLRKVKPIGGTPIGFGLSSAIEALAPARADEKRIILVTDGENNVGAPPREAALNAIKHGIKIDVIGIGDEINPLELEDVAERTGGTFKRYPYDGSLEEILKKIVGEAGAEATELQVGEAKELSELLAQLEAIESKINLLAEKANEGELSLDELSRRSSELEFKKRELVDRIRNIRSELSRRLIAAQMQLAKLGDESPEARKLRSYVDELRKLLERSEIGAR